MNLRSWVWALLLVLVTPATSAAQLPPAAAGQEAVCDHLNTELYGADGRHGLAFTYRVLKQQIAYTDQLIAHSRTKETADLRTLQQWQSRNPAARIRDVDLQVDRDLLTRFGSVRQQLESELENVVSTIVTTRGELQHRGCRERVDPKTGKNYAYETTPQTAENALCADIRERLLGLREDIAAVTRVLAFSTLVHNVLDEEQGLATAATGHPSSDVAAQLRIHDAALAKMQNSEHRDEAQDRITLAEAMRLASMCPSLQALVPSLPQPRPVPHQQVIVTQAMPRPIAGIWHAREDPSPTAPAYEARINDVDANGEYWGVIYKSAQWPIHFHGKFQGPMMPFAWYDNGSSGQGTLTYQDANHVMASWRDTGNHPGQSGTWYLSR
jgi:hypothetical protein